MTRPTIAIDPVIASGRPTIRGITVEHIAGKVWAEGVTVAMDEYRLDRAQVLVACWYVGAFGYFALAPKLMGRWAMAAEPLLAQPAPDYDTIPDPPKEQR